MLQIYNSFTGEKETFTPITPGKVNMYVCGMTVYDYCHLGHARVLIVFDMVSRYLRELGYEVNYVRNITDIDDKIINRANERDMSVEELTEYFITAMQADCQRLNVLAPDIEPRATHHIPEIIQLIEKLIEKGAAYQANNGDIYFDVSQFADYGELSNQDLDNVRSGTRVDLSDAKKDPLDFVLWKMAKPNEPSWESPWGNGRPGWHIECSAMSMHCLGEHLDIHGGGPDLKFPHHENEIAQSEAATGCKFANTWMHVGALNIKEEKMSKSLGNILWIREVTQQYSAETIRYFLLSSHYRSPLNYSKDNLQNAFAGLRRFYIAMRDLPEVVLTEEELKEDETVKAFHAAMLDDFNTPVALSVLFEMTHRIHKCREREPQTAAKLAAMLRQMAKPLGILQSDPAEFLQADLDKDVVANIEALIAEREVARKNKDWAKADEIRDQLTAMAIELEDTAEGTLWRKETLSASDED